MESEGPSVLVGFTGVYLVIYTLLTLFTVYRVVTKDRKKCFLTELIHELKTSKKIYFGLVFHVLDQASDYEACAEYFREWQSGRKDELNLDPRWWFFMSVTVLLIHRLISTAVIWHNTRNPRNTVLQLLDLAMVPAVYDGILHGYDKPGNVQRLLQGMEAIFESFPQLVLALVFLWRNQDPPSIINIQAVLSAITLTLRVSSEDAHSFPSKFERAKFNLCKCPPINPYWYGRVFLFRISEILGRLGVWPLSWTLLGWYWMLIFVSIEFVICKWASYEFARRIEPNIKLDFNWKSLDFYAYVLYFKPGYDHPYVMLYVRPLLIVAHWVSNIGLAAWVSPQRLSVFLITVGWFRSSINCVLPLLIHVFWRMISDSTERAFPEYMITKAEGAGINSVIRHREWEKASEMIRVGTNKMYVLSLIPLKEVLLLIDEHPEHELIQQLFGEETTQCWIWFGNTALQRGLRLKGNERLGLEESVQFVRVVRGLLDRRESSADVLSEVFSLAKHTGDKEDVSGAVSVIDAVMDGLMRERGLHQNTGEDGTPLLITLITRYGRNQDPFDLLIAKYLFFRCSDNESVITRALHTCAEDCHLTEVLRWLLKNGRIDPNMGDDWNRTPLFIAVIRRNEEGMRVLLENDKVDADKANKDGTTPLMIAVKNGYVSIVRQLVEHGCDQNIRDRNELTASDYALQHPTSEIVDSLSDANPIAPSSQATLNIGSLKSSEHIRSNSSSSVSVSVPMVLHDPEIPQTSSDLQSKDDDCVSDLRAASD